MLDNGWTYNFEKALKVGKALDELNFRWFESPMQESDENIEIYAKLQNAIETPICAPQAGEDTYFSRLKWIGRGASKMSRIEAHMPEGGVTACLKVIEASEKKGMELDLHMGGPFEYNLNVIGATSEETVEYVEMHDRNPAESAEHAGEIATYPQQTYLKFSRRVPGLDGYIALPEGPGLGVEIDWDFVQENRVNQG